MDGLQVGVDAAVVGKIDAAIVKDGMGLLRMNRGGGGLIKSNYEDTADRAGKLFNSKSVRALIDNMTLSEKNNLLNQLFDPDNLIIENISSLLEPSYSRYGGLLRPTLKTKIRVDTINIISFIVGRVYENNLLENSFTFDSEIRVFIESNPELTTKLEGYISLENIKIERTTSLAEMEENILATYGQILKEQGHILKGIYKDILLGPLERLGVIPEGN